MRACEENNTTIKIKEKKTSHTAAERRISVFPIYQHHDLVMYL
jgi:hypothetical protein